MVKMFGAAKAWATRHKVWASVIGVFAFLFVVGLIGDAVAPAEDADADAASNSAEKTAKPKPSPAEDTSEPPPTATPVAVTTTATPDPTQTRTPAPTATTAKPTANKKAPKMTAAARCGLRPAKGSEIFVRYLSNGDDPANSITLGAGYVWNFAEKKCITSAEYALNSDPGLPGYCTQVAYVDDNPGYEVDRIPSLPFNHPLAFAGDC